MDASWETSARRTPVPRRRPLAGRPPSDSWDVVRREEGERQECERIVSAFLTTLHRLADRAQDALISCAYLPERDLGDALAKIRGEVEREAPRLLTGCEHDLRSAGASLPTPEVSTLIERFRDCCDARIHELNEDIGRLPRIVQQRALLGPPGAEQASPDAPAGVAMGAVHGMALMISEKDGAGPGLVATIEAVIEARTAIGTIEWDSHLAISVPVWLAPGTISLELTGTGTYHRAAKARPLRCVALDHSSSGDPVPHPHQRVYLADIQEQSGSADSGDGSGREAPGDRSDELFGGQTDGTGPPVGVVIRGPAAYVGGGHRLLDADVLSTFARALVFDQIYEGTPRTAGMAMRAARAVQTVVFLDPGINGGLWVDLDPASREVASTLLIDEASDGLRAFRRSR
jgi:hypothetical protein